MALLEKLKVVASPATQPKTAEHQRRAKLIGRLQEQKALAEEKLGGDAYHRMRWVTVVNHEGEPVRVQRPVRLKQWWFKNAAGDVVLTIRYGAKPLVISNGMSAIEVGKLEELPSTIQTVIKAVDDGELDSELAAAVKGRIIGKSGKMSNKKQ